MSILADWATWYVQNNWRIYPIRRESKKPAVTGYHDWAMTATVETVREWWTKNPNDNIGTLTGRESSVVAYDCDPRNGGLDSHHRIEAEHGPLPSTCKTVSGREDGGFQLLYTIPQGFVIPSGEIAPGVEIIAEGFQVLLPPSIHPVGKKEYTWAQDGSLEFAPLPEFLIRLAEANRNQKESAAKGRIEGTGSRNVGLFTRLCSLRGRGADDEEIKARAEELNAEFSEPLDDAEVEKTVRSVCKYPIGKCPRPAELGASLLEQEHFISHHGTLYVYRAGRYSPDGQEYVERWVQEALGSHWTSAKAAEVVRWLSQRRRVRAEQVDVEDYVNVENGLLDWKTGTLHPHTPEVYSTVQFPVSWNPEATCSRADQFLAEILPSADVRKVVEEIIGYCLLPDCRYQKAAMFVGEGANGKSVLLDVITSLFGAENVSNESLHDLAGEDRFSPVSLLGKIANIFPDLPRQALKDAGKFKALVSGDGVSVQKKFGDRFSARMRAKLIFSANERPESRDLSLGFFRRWLIIPFPNRFEGRDDDQNLTERLTTPDALSYWLRIAVEGLRRLTQQGQFTTTDATDAALDQYRVECDTIRAFFDEACDLDDGATLTKQELYNTYREWCEDSGCGAKKKNSFFQRLYTLAPTIRYSRLNHSGTRVQSVVGIRLVAYKEQRVPGMPGDTTVLTAAG